MEILWNGLHWNTKAPAVQGRYLQNAYRTHTYTLKVYTILSEQDGNIFVHENLPLTPAHMVSILPTLNMCTPMQNYHAYQAP